MFLYLNLFLLFLHLTLYLPFWRYWSRGNSVGIALGYGLDDRDSRVRFPAGPWNFSLHHRVQNGSGAHPTSYLKDARAFPWG
jgi:hypothetical protein